MRLGLIKNLVLPEPEPPTTSTFLFRALAGFFGLPDIISPSLCVRMMLFSGFGSINGAISVLLPQRAEPYSTFLRYFLASFPLRYTASRTMTAPPRPTSQSIAAPGHML